MDVYEAINKSENREFTPFEEKLSNIIHRWVFSGNYPNSHNRYQIILNAEELLNVLKEEK